MTFGKSWPVRVKFMLFVFQFCTYSSLTGMWRRKRNIRPGDYFYPFRCHLSLSLSLFHQDRDFSHMSRFGVACWRFIDALCTGVLEVLGILAWYGVYQYVVENLPTAPEVGRWSHCGVFYHGRSTSLQKTFSQSYWVSSQGSWR